MPVPQARAVLFRARAASESRFGTDLARIFMKFWDFRKNTTQINFLNQTRATPVLPRA